MNEAWAELPTARVLESPTQPEGYLGSVGVIRPATDGAVKRARMDFIEANLDDFERDGMTWTDRATSTRYRVVRGGVLESLDPKRHASVFVVADNLLWFLQREGDDNVVESHFIGVVGSRKADGREPLGVAPEVY